MLNGLAMLAYQRPPHAQAHTQRRATAPPAHAGRVLGLLCCALLLISGPPSQAQPTAPGATDTPAAPGATNTQEPRFPYTAIVTQPGVEARAMASRNAYPVLQLKQGDLVQVQRVFFNWFRIDAPPGVYGFIRASDVDVDDPDRPTVGTVRANRTPVLTAHISGKPGPSTQTQGLVNKGDTVDILEVVDDHYKILSLEGAKVFLPPNTLVPASPANVRRYGPRTEGDEATDDTADDDADDATDVSPAPQTTDTDATTNNDDTNDDATPMIDLSSGKDFDATRESATLDDMLRENARRSDANADAANTNTMDTTATPAAAPGGPGGPGTADTPDTQGSANTDTAAADATPAVVDPAAGDPAAKPAAQATIPGRDAGLLALDERTVPLFMKPLREQPLDEMQAAYEGIRTDRGDQLVAIDRQLVAVRLAAIARNRELLAVLNRIDDTRTAQRAARDRDVEPVPNDYTAVGRLMASGIYDGVRMPRLLRVVDLTTGQTIAYVEPSRLEKLAGDSPVTAYLDKVVGLTGPIRLHSGYKLRLIDPQRIDLMTTESGQPDTARPDAPRSGRSAAPASPAAVQPADTAAPSAQ